MMTEKTALRLSIILSFFMIIYTAALFTACSYKNENKTKFTISVPDNSGQIRFYYHTNNFVVKNGCVEFTPIEDSLRVYTFCNSYDIYSR